MDKYGFVYLWYDKKRKMYYIGCHWGKDCDGYICSSNRMRNVYKRRPQDFKRRIIARIYTNKADLLEEEFKWLQMIPEDQLGKKYYNLRNHKWNHWSANSENTKTVGQKISMKLTSLYSDPKERQKISVTTKEAMSRSEVREKCAKSWFKSGDIPINKDKTLEELHGDKASIIRKKMSKAKFGTANWAKTQFKPGISSWNKGLKKLFITDGINNRVLYDTVSIPEGWYKGITRKKKA